MNNKLAAIAKWMNWDIVNDVLLDGGSPRYPEIDIADAKLIQQKLVDEGWNINMLHFSSGFQFTARRDPIKFRDEYEHITKSCIPAEPAAIVALAVKVWGIVDAENK